MIVRLCAWIRALFGLFLIFWCSATVAAAESVQSISKADFARPSHVPEDQAGIDLPSGVTSARVQLGELLFSDPSLSGDGTMACASCHMPVLAFGDGVRLGKGRGGQPLARHTPNLWNLAWNETFFWDGRARSLATQARGPLTNPLEMNADLDTIISRLEQRPAMAGRFARAFPGKQPMTVNNLLEAIAAYERTLVSPLTRFDRWVAGESHALTASEQAGFALFVGKAGCVACHSGWTFSDQSYHDIGLPTSDRGRGAILGEPALDHAFKTPGLRELAWTAPYMHDGSLASLADVLSHYERGVVRRPTLSPELPKLALTADERQQLLAFLGTLSSDNPPQPLRLDAASTAPVVALPALDVSLIAQRNRLFTPSRVSIVAGKTLTIVNDDTRPHNVRSYDPRVEFNGGVQEPGQSTSVIFDQPGSYELICAIHPTMKLIVDVRGR